MSQCLKNIVLMLPYFPHYRRDFVELLAYRLHSEGFELVVLSGENRTGKEIPSGQSASCTLQVVESGHHYLCGMHIGTQTGLVGRLKELDPIAVICLFNPGHIGHASALLYCMAARVPFLLWGSAYERVDAASLTRVVRQFVRWFFLRRAAGHICYGSELQRELLSRGISASRIWVAQNTVNVEGIAHDASLVDRAQARQSCGIAEDANVVLFVGALVPQKNLPALLLAFEKAAEKSPDLLLCVVGAGVQRHELEKIADKCIKTGRVVFTGAKYGEDLKLYFVSSDVFVMPGTGGLAVNEAMAYGLPVVAAKGDGTVCDLIEHEVDGYLLDNRCSSEEVLAALEWFLSLGLGDRGRLRINVQSKVLRMASLENMVDIFLDAVNQVSGIAHHSTLGASKEIGD